MLLHELQTTEEQTLTPGLLVRIMAIAVFIIHEKDADAKR